MQIWPFLVCIPMGFFVYILYSRSLGHFYIGQTQSLDERISNHLEKVFPQAYTSLADDWELFHSIACSSRNQSVRIERHIKRMKSRQYLLNLKHFPEITEKLKIKYS